MKVRLLRVAEMRPFFYILHKEYRRLIKRRGRDVEDSDPLFQMIQLYQIKSEVPMSWIYEDGKYILYSLDYNINFA